MFAAGVQPYESYFDDQQFRGRRGYGGGPSECDGKYHSDNDLLVALSTGWFNHKERCNKYIKIHGNGKSVKAKVVDECGSTRGWRSLS
ncbi:hypothetical protein V6N13_093486 [Hibiscus sabdariffa]